MDSVDVHSEPREQTSAEEAYPRIEPGVYSAICYRTRTLLRFSRRSLILDFRLYGGRYDGVTISMFCTYPIEKLSPAHKLYQQWTLAIARRPYRGERFSMRVFKNKMYSVAVRDSKCRLQSGSLKSDLLQYSVVDTIIETQTGTPVS